MKPQQGRTARYILWALGFPLALWLAAALADAFSGGASLSRVLARFSVCMNAPFSVRWTKDTGRFLLLGGLLYPAGAVAVESGRGNRRPGEEYGSARWGDPRTIGKKYRDRRHREKNILLTQHVALGLDGRITKRNTHQLIVGGSGAGKTRYFCLPNVMNACCSYIITDCKGEILRAVGGLFEKQGIPFTVLDLVNMRGHYNPFAYLRRDSDALRLVTNLVANTTPKDAKNSDPFWDRAETALLQALILYLKHRAPVCEQNFTMVMEMINAAEVREGDPNSKVRWTCCLTSWKAKTRRASRSSSTRCSSRRRTKPRKASSSARRSGLRPSICRSWPASQTATRCILGGWGRKSARFFA